MADTIRILGIYGSLREQSFNKKLIQEAQKLIPDGAEYSVFDRIGELPLFSEDIEKNPPQVIKDLKAQIRESDAILFATPEYNYSVSGVLKNLIDWASRPYGDSAWEGKCAAVMGASIGRIGTARAQYDLRKMFVFLKMNAVNQPEVMVTASNSFNDAGKLTDEDSRKLIKQLLSKLAELARLHKSGGQLKAGAAG